MTVRAATSAGLLNRRSASQVIVPTGDKKKDRIKQCRQNGRAAESVSFSFCWQTLGHRARAPSEQEAKHVGEVVTRVGDQRQRMAEKSENRFKDNIASVQRNTYCKCSIETRGRREWPVWVCVCWCAIEDLGWGSISRLLPE